MSRYTRQQVECQEFRVRRVLGEGTQQAAVRGTITVPAQKPPVEQIIKCNAKARVTGTEILRNKVIVQGLAEVKVIYVAAMPEGSQPVHAVQGELAFTQAFDIPGLQAGEDADVFVDLKVEDCKAHLKMNQTRHHCDDCVEKGKRQITVTIIIRVFVKVTVTETLNILTNAPGAEREEISLEQVVAFGSRQVVISDQVDVKEITAGVKPCPEQVIDVIAEVEVTQTEIISDRKVVVEGVLTVQVIYVAKTWEGDQPVHHVRVEIPFTQFVELDEPVQPDDIVDVMVRIEDVTAREKGKCSISISAVLQIRASVTRNIEVMVVTEFPDGQEVRIRSDLVVGQRMTQVVISDIIEIPPQKPPAQKALECEVIETRVTETELLPAADKVIVRGEIDVKAIYVADKPSQPVHAVEATIPFTTFVQFENDIRENDTVTVNVSVEFAECSLSDHDIKVDVVLKVTVKVTRIVQPTLFLCPEEVAPVPTVCPPGTTLVTYTVQPGDTLGSIAARFRTTVASIQELNPGIVPTNLQVGTVLRICQGGLG
ncbi:MAG: DUF3794 domain-containing protein [Thermoanaerobacterales bacterium]|nr:DUF3794 domain-containing protein [Thermoanaerobacterales bacterium]